MSKVGKFLIARPTLDVGLFRRLVIFIYEDSVDGVAGLALTVPSSLKFNNLFNTKEVDVSLEHHVLYKGGPIAPNAVMMLHTDDFSSSNTLHTGTGLDVSSDNLMTEKLIMGDRPEDYKFIVGCSAWQPGQLDSEIEQGFWLLSNLDNRIVFDLSGDSQWEAAVEYAGRQIIDQYF